MKRLHRGPRTAGAVLSWGLLALLSIPPLGCDDGGGGGGGDDVGDPDSGADLGASDAAVDAAAGCVVDDECAMDEFCGVPEGSVVGACAAGCRAAPDSCAAVDAATLCDPVERRCVERPCDADEACAADRWCDAGDCVEGCRVAPDNCPEADGVAQVCDPSDHRCAPLVACCGAAGECSLGTPASCAGEPQLGFAACAPDPCGPQCAGDEDCGLGAFCDDRGRCFDGCQPGVPGSCPEGEICAVDLRRCVPAECEADRACEAWQYCGVDGLCVAGCRADPDNCPAGQRCGTANRCESVCADDEDCPGGYCLNGACRLDCDPVDHSPCGPGERCDGATLRCVPGCADDPLEGAPIALGAEPIEAVACPGDADVMDLVLEAPGRIELVLQYDSAQASALSLRLSAAGELLAQVEDLEAPKVLRYPALGAALLPPGTYQVEVRIDGPQRRSPYRLAARVGAGCFPDARDPGDDVLGGATPAGLQALAISTDAFTGALCEDDVDWYCFPMTPDDGLDVVVAAPAGCGPITGELASRDAFELGEALPYALAAEAPAPQGDRYRFTAAPEAGAFTAATWCLRLRGGPCEDQSVALRFERRGVLCSDPLEPNDGVGAAVALDGDGRLAGADGALPYDLDLELPVALDICEGDADLFSVNLQQGDVVRAWVVAEEVRGELLVQLLDAQGQPRGETGGANPDPQGMSRALTIAPADTRFYVRVTGVAASTGAYRLFVRRERTEGLCAQELYEVPGDRNDVAADATNVALEQGRGGLVNGAVCNPEPESPDVDWYRFEVPADDARLCVQTRFRDADGDLDLQLFRAGLAAGEPCLDDADCEGEGTAFCVERRCQSPLGAGSTRGNGEFVHLPKFEVDEGAYLARVFSPAEADNNYDLVVTTVPEEAACARDWQERERPNDDVRTATDLGAQQVMICDAWICRGERNGGDWYRVHVPEGVDRTVHVSFAPRSDGVILLSYVDAEDPAGFAESAELNAGVQCINIQSADEPADIFIGVTADSVLDDGDTRVDYVLQVVDTNLGREQRGACDTLSGGLFRHLDWPTVRIER